MLRTIVLSAVAVLALAGCAGERTVTNDATPVAASTTAADATTAAPAPSTSAKDADAVKVTSCVIGEYGVTFTGTLKNITTEVSDYMLSVEVVDAKGDRVDEGGATVASLKPGQSAKWDGSGLADPSSLPKSVSCRLLSVDRLASS